MKIFDPHIHCIARTTSDYEKMAEAGVEIVVEPAFWLGEPRKYAGTFFDYFDHLVNFETERARQYGIKHYATIAVNPREANDLALAEEVLARIPEWLSHKQVVAVGEIGFDDQTKNEEKIFRAHVDLGMKHNLPILVHTPHREKKKGTERIIAILKEMKIPLEKLLIDHNTEETIRSTRDFGCWAGHTVYPSKLSPERAVNIFQQYGVEKMLVNSAADWGPADPLSVPYTIDEMKKRSFSESDIQKLVWDNPWQYFAQAGRF